MKILGIKETVKNILTIFPATRDNDELLTILIWKENKYKYCTDFFEAYINKQIPSPDAITRARRKLQEEIPELRGKYFNIRQEHSFKVKDEIRHFFNPEKKQEERLKIRKIIKEKKAENIQQTLFD